MTKSGNDDPHLITDVAALRALYAPTSELAAKKCIHRLDEHCRALIARSPFLCLGTRGPDGMGDVSPRGDPPGFVQVMDDHTLAIPDRPGNNRLDSLSNIIAEPSVGLLFLVPGFDETLRINGQARITTNPDLLQTMSVRDRSPKLAIVVTVSEAFLHCAKAFRRSRLWDPDARQDRSELPSLAKIILDQTTGVPEDQAEMAEIDAELEASYRRSMY